jgi:chorismate mutase/prephenate dehydratase
LTANKIEVEFTASTADACRIVAERKEPGLAAIAATKGADTFGLFVKQTRLEDFTGGKTRMALISRNLSSPTGHDKTTFVITPVADRNGLLSDILICFAKRDIGLTSISSRPLKTRLGEYTFMISVRGHIGEPTLQAAIMDVSNLGAAVKVLGSYPMNPEISSARVGESLPPGSVTSDVLKEWVDRLVKAATEVPR